jgi:hypothetical protein
LPPCQKIVGYYEGVFGSSSRDPTVTFRAQYEITIEADTASRKIRLTTTYNNETYAQPATIGFHSFDGPTSGTSSEFCDTDGVCETDFVTSVGSFGAHIHFYFNTGNEFWEF